MSSADVLNSRGMAHPTTFEPLPTTEDKQLQKRDLNTAEALALQVAQDCMAHLKQPPQVNSKLTASVAAAESPVEDEATQKRERRTAEELNHGVVQSHLDRMGRQAEPTRKILTAEAVQKFQEKLDNTTKLEDLILLVQWVHLLLHVNRIYLNNEQMRQMHEEQRRRSDEKADLQKAPATSALQGGAGIGMILGSLLGAFDQTGMFKNFIPALLGNGQVVGAIGNACQSFSGIASSSNQSKLTRVEAAERSIGEALYSLRTIGDMEKQEKGSKIDRVSQELNKDSEAKSKILS